MKSSVYISAEEIQVIGYSGKNIKKYASFPLPEGTMYNGTITDSAFLAECLASMKKDNPALFKGGVSLMVDGSSILCRKLMTPRLNNRQYLQLVRDDFVDSIPDVDSIVCEYRKLSPENAILGCAVNKSQVDSYIATFKEAGIKLKGIHIGAELIIAYVKSKPNLHKSTVVINVLDGPTMLSMLFVKGSFIFMSRARLYGDDKEQNNEIILENLNGLIQFTQSQNLDEIRESFYLGINHSDVVMLAERNTHPEISLNSMAVYRSTKGKDIPPQAHFACLDMLYGKTGIELLDARRELDKYIKRKRPKKVWIPLLILYIILLALPAGWLLHEINIVENDIQEIEAFINAPQTVQKMEELNDIIQRTAEYNNVLRQAEALADWESLMPPAASHIAEFIIFGHGVDVTVNSFDFNERTGIVRISAITPDASTSVHYVDALYASGLVQAVFYQGYGSGADGMVSFTIEIVLYVEGEENAD
ncbi:MAG: hypothetical protein FWB80_06645 [Defluviitaleaceae bacterium]|nr:hypothetical protein [Defluviitaleaceae bacterium]